MFGDKTGLCACILCFLCDKTLKVLPSKVFIYVLKVLSSEMDPAGIRLVRKVFNKERGAEVFRKICPSPILRVPFSCWQLGNEFPTRDEIHRTVGIGGTCLGFFKMLDLDHFN